MRRSDYFRPRAYVGVLFTVLILSVAAYAQRGGADESQLPRGNYAVSCSPFMGPGYESLPVLVTGVTSEVDGGIAVTGVSIENRTDKTLAGVRLVWYLSRLESPQYVLQQGRTKLLNLRRGGGIEAGETREVVTPVVAFADIYKPLLRGGALKGKYLVHVAVGEARFDDGSVQPLMSSDRKRARVVRFERAAYRVPPKPPTQTFCPNQKCEVATVNNVPVGYTCTSGNGQSCTNTATGKSCTSNICGSGTRPPIQA